MQVYGFGSGRRQNIAMRIEKLGRSLLDCFFISGPGLNSRYILEVDSRYACLLFSNKRFIYQLYDDAEALIDFLSEEHQEFSPTLFDEMAMVDHPLPTVMRENRPDCLQLFSWQQPEGTQLYLLDENGALFHQFVHNADEKHLLVQQQRFFNSLADRRALLSVDTAKHSLMFPPLFYRVSRAEGKDWQLDNITLPETPVSSRYADLELVISQDADELQNYRVICGQQEFDYLQLRNDIYVALASHVLSLRNSHQRYPVYLTSVMPASMDDDQSWSTIHLLNFKKRLENQVNIALNQLAFKQ